MFDVIVIGARCAGSPVAVSLARSGHRVLLVDRASFPSDTLSSHLMLPRGASYLERLGLLEKVLATTPSFEYMSAIIDGIVMRGRVSESALAKRFRELHGEELVRPIVKWISVRRLVLDKILVDAAAEAGAEIREQLTVEDFLRDDAGRVTGIRARTSSGTIVEERAQVVVGADGRHSFMAKKLGLEKSHHQPSISFCYWGYYEGCDLDSIGGPQLNKRGRLRVAAVPTHGGAAAVSVWGPGEWFHEFRANREENVLLAAEYAAPALAAMIRQGTLTEPLFGSADLANFIHPSHGPGWALVGDAAASHDQCSAIGMSHALRDAELLSSELNGALSGRSGIDDALRRYGERRTADHTLEYHQFICEEAQMNAHTYEELNLFAAMRGNQDAQNMSLGMIADIVRPSEFHDSRNIAAIKARAAESVEDYPISKNWDAIQSHYRKNPFVQRKRLSL